MSDSIIRQGFGTFFEKKGKEGRTMLFAIFKDWKKAGEKRGREK